MALTTAERNKRKRERKKRERAEAQKLQQQQLDEDAANKSQKDQDDDDVQVEIEYVAEPPPESNRNNNNQGDDDDDEQDLQAVMRRFQDRAALVYVTDGEEANNNDSSDIGTSDNNNAAKEQGDTDNNLDDDNNSELSKTKLKAMFRPTVAELKQRSLNPELVEAHDITGPDPDFLIYLKGIPGTVPVPRHWGRKRKYLQGKRGVEKPPFALPDFIVKTGICDVRDATAEDDAKQSVKQKNRARVSGKAGGVDVDYRTLYEAFFQHQTKPENLTDFGDLYYEGREYETARSSNFRPGFMSERLREALGMANEYTPPPWLINMQRYGPPPSYPNARIPGLNAPLPTGASYGYHVGGWGKPPVDAFGRPLYGGDPFGQPEVPNKEGDDEMEDMYGLAGGLAPGAVVTSDGKALGKKSWGALPNAFGDGRGDNDEDEEEEESSSEEEESSDEEMDESDEEDGQLEVPDGTADAESHAAGMDSVLPDGVDSVVPSSAIDLRKPGDETPMLNEGPKQLYTVLQQTAVDKGDSNAVFASDHAYVLPGAGPGSGVPEGAASVLSKAGPAGDGKKRARPKDDEDEADELGKKFKF